MTTGTLFSQTTMLVAMLVMVSSSLYDSLADRELERMIERNKILQDKLIREKGPEPEKLQKKRELLMPSEDKLKLEVEEELHKKLLANGSQMQEG